MPSRTDPVASAELVAFLTAYETRTVQEAADALNLTQSAVTKRIQSLERRLGAALFERSRRGVTPTRLGQMIYAPAKEALAQLHAVALAAEALRATDRAELPLAASRTIGEFLLPGWLSTFRSVRPEVHPQLEVNHSAGVLEAVAERRVAIGFVEGPTVPANLDRLVVASDELVVVVAAGHPWARRQSVPPSALPGEPYLTREPGSGTRDLATAALAAHGIELSATLEAASTEGLKRLIASGGFSILSRLTIEEEERTGSLVGRGLRGVDLSRQLFAVRQPPRSRVSTAQPSPAESFWVWLASAAASHSLHAPGPEPAR